MLELNKVHNMNCISGMKMLEDKSIDLILTDPPYGINLEYDTYKDTEENWYELMSNAMPEMLRVSKMVILPCCQIARLGWFYKNFPPLWLIAWYKGSTGHRSAIGFNDWEPLLVYGRTENLSMHDYLKVQPTPFDNGHPCPKPIKWARWLIERATKKNDIVLDPFTGSGTTLMASKELARRFIGFEISPTYCKIAEKRLSQQTLHNLMSVVR